MTSAPVRAVVRLAVGSLLGFLALVAMSTPALAHDQLVDSSPGADEQLESAPAQVRLDFTDDVLTIGAAVVVVDGSGRTWSSGEAVIDGTSVSVTVDPGMPDGTYEVRWRVVSSDGHVISDAVPFTVGDATGAAPSAPDAAPSATPVAVADAERTAGPASSPWRSVAVGTLGALLGLGLYGVRLVARGRRRGHPGAQASSR